MWFGFECSTFRRKLSSASYVTVVLGALPSLIPFPTWTPLNSPPPSSSPRVGTLDYTRYHCTWQKSANVGKGRELTVVAAPDRTNACIQALRRVVMRSPVIWTDWLPQSSGPARFPDNRRLFTRFKENLLGRVAWKWSEHGTAILGDSGLHDGRTCPTGLGQGLPRRDGVHINLRDECSAIFLSTWAHHLHVHLCLFYYGRWGWFK